MTIVKVVVHEGMLKDFAKIHYSDGSKTITTVKEAVCLARLYEVTVEQAK